MIFPYLSFILFTVLIIVSVVSFLRRNNFKLFSGLLFFYLLLIFFIFLENKYQFRINDFLILLVVLNLYGHFFLGENLRLYYTTRYFDRFLHAFGTFAFTLFTYSVMVATLNPEINPNLFEFIFIVSLGVLLGVIFELIEFLADSFFRTKTQSGLKDTDFDLIFDIIGAILAGLIVIYTANT